MWLDACSPSGCAHLFPPPISSRTLLFPKHHKFAPNAYSIPQLPSQSDDAQDSGEADTGKGEQAVAKARVWTRKRLAELCGISESQVVEWAILMGNDYTRELSFSGIGLGTHKSRRPEQVWWW